MSTGQYKYAPYSFSRLSTYKSCPRKFKYAYIDKAPRDYTDRTALLKGGAIHSILEHHPDQSTHKLAHKYQKIVDSFLSTDLGKKYMSRQSIREFNFGLDVNLNVTSYSSKDAVFRGSVDYICIGDTIASEIMEVDSLDDIPDDYEIIEVIDDD